MIQGLQKSNGDDRDMLVFNTVTQEVTQVINKRCRKIISGVNKQKSTDDGFS